MRVLPMLALLTCLLGCGVHGVNPRTFDTAMGPTGVTVTLRVRGERGLRRGELYAVDSAAALLVARHADALFPADTLYRVRWSAMQLFEVSKFNENYRVYRGATPDEARRQRLALLSRFPQGLSGARLVEVLAKLSQEAVLELP